MLELRMTYVSERVQHALDFIARQIVWKLLSDFLNNF
jgi:hypothetical protein